MASVIFCDTHGLDCGLNTSTSFVSRLKLRVDNFLSGINHTKK